MRPEVIEDMKRRGFILQRSKDIPQIRSLLSSAQSTAQAALGIPLNESTSTIIFREIYESVRQLGQAFWWALGYETDSHEACMKILGEADIPEKLSLHKLERFRKIRHDSHYRGYLISPQEAKEIINFWKRCGPDLVAFVEEKGK